MSIELKPHNVEAYKKVKEKLNTSNKVAVIHPTGTGKMYIALKMLEENKDKKAIYIAPFNTILHDVKKTIFAEGLKMSDFPNLTRITYQKLMNLSNEEIENLDADIIILDEFHHCGAPEWGKSVERLMQRNPNANILGLSATPLRYFDDLRDMVDELFDNNVASEMTLEEAIEQGILPEATYVSTFYGYDVELKDMKANIDIIKDENKRKQAEVLFDSLIKKIDENTINLPELLAEHMKNATGKYIIFCKNIQDMQEKMAQASKMFGSVNSNITVRGISSKIKDNENILKSFENDYDENSLKLLYAVDMLNEGYHIKDLDGVVMMRPTFSPTIFTQQLGRALTVGGDKKPVVLDLVNNFDTCKIIEDFTEKMRRYKSKEETKSPKEERKSRISIYDKTKEFRDIVSKITELSKRETISLEEKIEIFERFSEIGEELTGSTIFEDYPVGQWAIQIRSLINRMNEGRNEKIKINPSEEQLDRLAALGILNRQINSTIDEKIQSLVEWMEKYPKAKISMRIPKDILKEYATTDEEYKRIIEEYEKMQRYYGYVKQRKRQNKLTEKQIWQCKEGNIKGIFGYPSSIERLAKKCGQPEKTIDYIISNYGTMDNFKELYRIGQLDEKDSILASSMIRRVIDIDLNPNNKNYDNLYFAILGSTRKENGIELYSSENLKAMLEELNPREKYVIERKFGLADCELPKDLERELGVTKGKIRKIEAESLRKLRYYSISKKIIYTFSKSDMLTDEEVRLIHELEDNLYSSDIIFSNNPYEMLQNDDKSADILKALELIKNMDKITEERKKQAKAERAKRYATPLENINISVKAYNYFKKIGIEKIADLRLITEKDTYLLIKELGKEAYIQLLGELKKYYDDIVDDYQEVVESLTEEDIERVLEESHREEKEDIFDTRLEKLKLPVRVYNCLIRANINTLRDISKLSREELLNIKNLGRIWAEEIIKKIEEYGITLKEEIDLDSSESLQEHEENENGNKPKNAVSEGQIAEDGFLGEAVGFVTKNDVLNTRIEELELSIRAYNCLIRANINTLRDISKLSREELLSINNLGKSRAKEIIKKIEEYGITLKEEIDLDSSESLQEHEENENGNKPKNAVSEGQIAEDEFLGKVVRYATKKVELSEKDEQAKKLEKQYEEQLPKDQYTVDDD